jgi:hypothetical protein
MSQSRRYVTFTGKNNVHTDIRIIFPLDSEYGSWKEKLGLELSPAKELEFMEKIAAYILQTSKIHPPAIREFVPRVFYNSSDDTYQIISVSGLGVENPVIKREALFSIQLPKDMQQEDFSSALSDHQSSIREIEGFIETRRSQFSGYLKQDSPKVVHKPTSEGVGDVRYLFSLGEKPQLRTSISIDESEKADLFKVLRNGQTLEGLRKTIKSKAETQKKVLENLDKQIKEYEKELKQLQQDLSYIPNSDTVYNAYYDKVESLLIVLEKLKKKYSEKREEVFQFESKINRAIDAAYEEYKQYQNKLTYIEQRVAYALREAIREYAQNIVDEGNVSEKKRLIQQFNERFKDIALLSESGDLKYLYSLNDMPKAVGGLSGLVKKIGEIYQRKNMGSGRARNALDRNLKSAHEELQKEFSGMPFIGGLDLTVLTRIDSKFAEVVKAAGQLETAHYDVIQEANKKIKKEVDDIDGVRYSIQEDLDEGIKSSHDYSKTIQIRLAEVNNERIKREFSELKIDEIRNAYEAAKQAWESISALSEDVKKSGLNNKDSQSVLTIAETAKKQFDAIERAYKAVIHVERFSIPDLSSLFLREINEVVMSTWVALRQINDAKKIEASSNELKKSLNDAQKKALAVQGTRKTMALESAKSSLQEMKSFQATLVGIDHEVTGSTKKTVENRESEIEQLSGVQSEKYNVVKEAADQAVKLNQGMQQEVVSIKKSVLQVHRERKAAALESARTFLEEMKKIQLSLEGIEHRDEIDSYKSVVESIKQRIENQESAIKKLETLQSEDCSEVKRAAESAEALSKEMKVELSDFQKSALEIGEVNIEIQARIEKDRRVQEEEIKRRDEEERKRQEEEDQRKAEEKNARLEQMKDLICQVLQKGQFWNSNVSYKIFGGGKEATINGKKMKVPHGIAAMLDVNTTQKPVKFLTQVRNAVISRPESKSGRNEPTTRFYEIIRNLNINNPSENDVRNLKTGLEEIVHETLNEVAPSKKFHNSH